MQQAHKVQAGASETWIKSRMKVENQRQIWDFHLWENMYISIIYPSMIHEKRIFFWTHYYFSARNIYEDPVGVFYQYNEKKDGKMPIFIISRGFEFWCLNIFSVHFLCYKMPT